MSEEREEWKVPEDLIKKHEEAEAMLLLRDKYASLPLGFKKAMKCSIKNVQLSREFWANIRGLYPELKDKSLSHNYQSKVVYIAE